MYAPMPDELKSSKEITDGYRQRLDHLLQRQRVRQARMLDGNQRIEGIVKSIGRELQKAYK
jgi:hypothetical protein